MHGQQVLSWFSYRQRPCGQSRVQRFFTVTVASGALLKAVQAVGLLGDPSGQLPWAETWVWSLARLKVCYLLFACRNLSASYTMGGHFIS